MIRRIVNSLYHRYNRCPRVGQWFATSNGHVLRVCLVSTESQKVVNYWGVTTPSVTHWWCFSPEKCLNAWEVCYEHGADGESDENSRGKSVAKIGSD